MTAREAAPNGARSGDRKGAQLNVTLWLWLASTLDSFVTRLLAAIAMTSSAVSSTVWG